MHDPVRPENKRPEERKDSAAFSFLCGELLQRGAVVRFLANGSSMQPNILDGDKVVVASADSAEIARGDVALTQGPDGLRVHRLVYFDIAAAELLTRGDSGRENDRPAHALLGKVVSIERGVRKIPAHGRRARLVHAARSLAHRGLQFAKLRTQRARTAVNGAACLMLLALLCGASPAAGQTLTVTFNPAPTSPVAPGDTITYIVVIAASGGTTVNPNITVAIPTPTNTTFSSAAKSGGSGTWTCNNNSGTPTCTDTASYLSGRTTTFTFAFTVNTVLADGVTPIPNGTTINATVQANSANTLPSSSSASVTVQTPEISMSDSGSPNPTTTGGTITYTQTVTNNGTDEAVGVSISETTPMNTTFTSATPPTGWTCGTLPAAGGTGTITCSANAGTFVAAAGTAVVTVVVTVNTGTLSAAPGTNIANTTISNTVVASETGTQVNTSNNTATATVLVSSADLSMTQSVSPAVIAQGAQITYTEVVTNDGPTAAVLPVVYQQTPPNTVFVSAAPPSGWTCATPAAGATGQIICTDGSNLAASEATTAFTIIVQVNTGTTPVAGTIITNYADVTSQSSDPNVSDNMTSTFALVEVTGQADLAITGTASPTPVFISSTLTYTFQVQDLGLASATGASFSDTLPSGVTYVSATTTQGTCSQTGVVVSCALGTVVYPSATPVTITITVTSPTGATTLTNSPSVSTSLTDPVAGNNTVVVITVVQPLICATPGKDGAGGTLSGVVNAYYPPAATGTVAAGATTIVLGKAATNGAQIAINPGDLLLIIQMQAAQINSTDTTAYGSGIAGNPSGYTSLANTGYFEFVTATTSTINGGVVATTGGTLTFIGTGAGGGLLNSYTYAADTSTQGAQTFQVIRVPQYSSAKLGSSLAAMGWNGLTGGVLAIDVASQLTLGGTSGTVTLDGLGFRGGGGINMVGSATGANTDTVVTSPATLPALPPAAKSGADDSKGEGIAGTPHWLAPALSTITHATTAVSSGQTPVEGLPNGSFARGAPGNAGGGATDADIVANDQNSGGGGGANGGAGGIGGFGWNTAGLVGGYGGASFPASTSALVMGGGGGAGTTNNGSYWDFSTETGNTGNTACTTNCTGIYSSGAAGGAILIIHAGSVVATGTITSNGQSGLTPENDGGGGGGAGGTIRVLANTGDLAGLTASATGGSGGNTWPEQVSSTFPGNRHGPGGGGGGGAIFASSAPGSSSVAGGTPGWSTLANDPYGATSGLTGTISNSVSITQTPGTQSGAYCAGADLAVTDSGTPSVIAPGGTVTYTQTVTNNGPQDALNATFSEAIPANTTFQSIAISGAGAAGWTCTTTGAINCTNPDVPSGSTGNTTFTVAVASSAATPSGTQIVDTVSVSSGTKDPVLTNNTASVNTLVAATGTANLSITNTPASPTVTTGSQITYAIVVSNNGPSSATGVLFTETIPASPGYGTFNSITIPTGWICPVLPASGGTGTISCCPGTGTTCSNAAFTSGSTAGFTLKLNTLSTTPSGTVISETASVSSNVTDPNPETNSATANVTVGTSGQYDLSLSKTASPNPVPAGNSITFNYVLKNNGPSSASSVVLNDSVPANTTFLSATIPGGWICPTLPAAGGTGAISCCPGTGTTCSGAAVASGTSVSFTIVEKVGLSVPPTTVITNNANVTPTTNDLDTLNNSASASTVVASPTQADVSIVKTASPEPVDQGTNLTYTLQVMNNGPAVAQNVTVSDTLPTQVTYTSVSSAVGTCGPTGGTVSCSLGSLSVGSAVTIIINVQAATFSSTTLASNTATVLSTTSDPNSANNSSTAVSTIEAPTAVQLSDFSASLLPGGGVFVEWHTKEEVRNLGFHLYRDDAQGHHRLDPSLIAGSALVLRGGSPQHAAKTYQWTDPAGDAQSSYTIEDVDLNGTRTQRGPVYAQSFAPANVRAAQIARPPLLSQINAAVAVSAASVQSRASNAAISPSATASVMIPGGALTPHLPTWGALAPSRTPQAISSAALNGVPAVKISVSSEGWYAITGAQLYAAGLSPRAEAVTLQLYAEGVEQPIAIVNANAGAASFFADASAYRPLGASDTIQFFGTGIDTPFSDTRVYWLINGPRPGQRITSASLSFSSGGFGAGAAAPASFPFTVFLQQRTTYFAALLNGENNDNFFGAVVSSDPVDQPLTVVHSDPASTMPVTFDVTLQGATDQQAHSVSVAFNGISVGEMDFANQANVTNTFSLPSGLLQNGVNIVTLTALDGDNDVSLVQSIALHYAHTYAADSDWLRATVPPAATVHITGFANAQVKAFDITDPLAITQLAGRVTVDSTGYGITVASAPAGGTATRTLLVFSADQIAAPDALAPHTPNNLADAQSGAQYVVIAHPLFAASAAPLLAQHQSEGLRTQLVTTDQIFDAFNYGERSPFALRSFLQLAATRWSVKPQAVLLLGDASLDPRDYLGFGDFDLVPTRMIETIAFKTSSDDWLTDFQQTGFATIPTGRIPADTVDEAMLAITRIVNYERGATAGSWQQLATIVADENTGNNFSAAAQAAAGLLPSSMTVQKILADGQDPTAVQQQIVRAIDNGTLLVDYSGHGAEDQWSFADIFDDTTVANLSNGDRLPVFLLMDCLNGFFQDVYANSLAEDLLFAPNGGAVAVWASSGFTDAPPQATMNQALLGALAANPSTPLGQAILQAKTGITDPDVRRTWILFGDPAMRIPLPAVRSTTSRFNRQ